jgi:predicted nucleotidyltransferase
MDREQLINEILDDLSFLPKDIPGIFLYGSYGSGSADERSDIDICLVSGTNIDPQSLQVRAWRNITSEKYDIRIFELLPLFIQIQILNNGLLIYAPDPPALYEYLYRFWKRWDDQRWYQTPIHGEHSGDKIRMEKDPWRSYCKRDLYHT